MDRVYCLHKNDSDPNHELYVKAKNININTDVCWADYYIVVP